ncbi:hypothetical protein AERO9A_340081 [Aeromonas salmonicida]|nr:hypothetical protein AERO9A_340081 [Aeromonas salmonicida]
MVCEGWQAQGHWRTGGGSGIVLRQQDWFGRAKRNPYPQGVPEVAARRHSVKGYLAHEIQPPAG